MTRTLPLRSEQPPDDAAVVLRAGVMASEVIRGSAERTFDAYAVFGLSVEGVIDQTVLDACRGERVAGYRQIRLSTFGRLRSAGFALLATFDHPHFTIVLPDGPGVVCPRHEGGMPWLSRRILPSTSWT